MNKELQDIKERIALIPPEEGIAILSDYIASHPEDTDALTLRGMKYFGAGRRAEAIKDYLAALDIDPDSPARLALQSANEILDFYNKDLFNP